MKELSLKESTTKINGQDVKISYKELVESCLKQVGREGINAVEMERRINIVKVLRAAKNKLSLEDADAVALKELVEKMPWSVVDEAVLEFCKDVKKM